MERDVRGGFTGPAQVAFRRLYFYDDRGSRLFDEITRLPEYYPTRSERSILDAHAKDMILQADADVLIELGAGTCEKSRVLLDAMQSCGRLGRYVPLDVSDTTLWEAATSLAEEYPGLRVHAVVGDFHQHLDQLPTGGDRRLFAFLGGTIGNLDPGPTPPVLHATRQDHGALFRAGDRLLLGTDLIKDRGRLVRAYDDAAGVTAEFNRNVLHVLNRELGADFDPGAPSSTWPAGNERDQRIEMWLRSSGRPDRIRAADLDLRAWTSRSGEEMLTEISTKFSPAALEAELRARAEFVVESMPGRPRATSF